MVGQGQAGGFHQPHPGPVGKLTLTKRDKQGNNACIIVKVNAARDPHVVPQSDSLTGTLNPAAAKGRDEIAVFVWYPPIGNCYGIFVMGV